MILQTCPEKRRTFLAELAGRLFALPPKKEDADRSSLDTRVRNLQTRIDNDVENLKNYASQIANLAAGAQTRKKENFRGYLIRCTNQFQLCLQIQMPLGLRWTVKVHSRTRHS